MTEERKWEEKLDYILWGIDRTELDDEAKGWWGTSLGASFGAKKLKEIQNFIKTLRAKDKERLLEGLKTEMLKYEISGKHYLIQELEKVINKLYE